MDITEKLEEMQEPKITVSSLDYTLNGNIIQTNNLETLSTGIYTLASNVEPLNFRRYIQLTEEEYDTMLERIAQLEQRVLNLERGIF